MPAGGCKQVSMKDQGFMRRAMRDPLTGFTVVDSAGRFAWACSLMDERIHRPRRSGLAGKHVADIQGLEFWGVYRPCFSEALTRKVEATLPVNWFGQPHIAHAVLMPRIVNGRGGVGAIVTELADAESGGVW